MAVSGGGDSVALVHLLAELADAGHLVLAGLAHLNHQLRPDAARDEEFCHALAGAVGVPFDAARVDVAAVAATARSSPEVAARQVRYAFFDEVRTRRAAAAVAVAHTRDDQAETVLLRLLRGAGTRGLRGALPSRGGVVRPLLTCGRDELRAYLRARGAAWVEDETNADTAILRNRIRHDLLPRLVRDYQPGAPRILARTAELAHDDDAYLSAVADTAAAAVTSKKTGGVCLDVPGGAGVAAGNRPAGRAAHARGGGRGARRAARRRRPDLRVVPDRAGGSAYRWRASAWNVFPLTLSY